ncbi:TerC family protein [Maritalea sp.]|uniref:TerC family protein n=1 Tax=Maritalea sp. TaxID=2003361 RepID=UPI003EF556C2
MGWISDPAIWASLATLTAMEIILGIDNIVFISVLVSRLPEKEADKARKIGLALALVARILMLLVLTWIIGLTQPLFSAFGHDFAWRDVILIAGGLFLLYKATHEIHQAVEDPHTKDQTSKAGVTFMAIIGQIIIIDIVFSVDSIVTAIGMAQHVPVMVAAVTIAMVVMYIGSIPISKFIAEHPTTKMLALAFLMLIGMSLVADGIGFHIPKGYIYFAMAFATGVESINVLISLRKKNGKKVEQ